MRQNSVEFNLQDYLRDMESRLGSKIEACHQTVLLQNTRIKSLEGDSYKIRWLWRTVLACGGSAISWIGYRLFGP